MQSNFQPVPAAMLQKICVNIDSAELNRLDKLAALHGSTRSKILRLLVAAWVKGNVDTCKALKLESTLHGSPENVLLFDLPPILAATNLDQPAVIKALWPRKNNT